MAHLLHIDASPRGERSHSRRMTREFVQQRLCSHQNDESGGQKLAESHCFADTARIANARQKITELVTA